MTRTDAWIKKLGQKRNSPYLYLDGLQAVRAGFSPGDKYDIAIDGEKLVLSANKDGSRTVSRKMRGDKELPVIDINSGELLAMFKGMDSVRIMVREDKVFILPLASEIKKKARLARLKDKVANGHPIEMGSLSHGGGILSHAIHAGLEKAGLKANLAFANEIREDLVEQAALVNNAWNADTCIVNMPMQELAQDEYMLKQLPLLEVLEMGLPCSGASKAGKSKRGLSMMEDHPDVGHLVVAALIILDRTQPAFVLLENVPEYASSASAQILRHQLRDMGYSTCEAILSGKDFGCLENRVRWCMVAHTKGTTFSFEDIEPTVKVVRLLGEVLDDIPGDDPRWREVAYLKDKMVRDKAAGKGFGMQFITPDSSSVPTIRKGYAKGGSTDPRLLHPDDATRSRLLTAAEHARVKGVPNGLIAGLSETLAHQQLGQGIVYVPFEQVGRRIGECIATLSEAPIQDIGVEYQGRSFGIG
ncbi:MAG: DNA cytosine methyltransferase [Sideroxyarcus sp.]|nr:DNA cytosine methyltransferase [Sideroxyarcus sp.]